MQKLQLLVAVLLGLGGLTAAAWAQETNCCPALPPTKLAAFETNTDTVIIRANAAIGTVTANAGSLQIRCREMTEASTGRKELGVVVDFEPSGGPDQALIDYDELDGLLGALDFLNRVDWTVTSLPGFDASYTTKGGFRVVAFGSRRTGSIEFAARLAHTDRQPLLLSRDQVAQLRGLLDQAKSRLEPLRKGS